MIRALLDANVWIAGLLSPAGAPAELLRHFESGVFDAVVCPALLDELTVGLARPWFRGRVTGEGAASFVAHVHRMAIKVPDQRLEEPLCRDPDDDYLIAVALSAEAILVTSDRALLELDDAPIPILSPRAFLDALG